MQYSKIKSSYCVAIFGFTISVVFSDCVVEEPVAPETPSSTTAPIIDIVQNKTKWLAISDFRVKNQFTFKDGITSSVTPYLVTNLGYENGVFKQIGMVRANKINMTNGIVLQDDTTYSELTFSKTGSSRTANPFTFKRCNYAKYRTNTHILDYYKPNTILNVHTSGYGFPGYNGFYPNIIGDETYMTGGNIPGGIGSQIFINLKRKNEPDTLYTLQDPEGVQITMPFMMADKQLYCLIKKNHALMIRTRLPNYTDHYTLAAGSNDRYLFAADLEITAFPICKYTLSSDGKKCFFWVNAFVEGKTWGFEFDQTTQVMTLKTKLQLQPYEFVTDGIMDENGDYYYVSPVQGSTFNTVRKITMSLPSGTGSITYGTNIVIPDVTIKIVGKSDGKLVLQANASNTETVQCSILIEK